MSIKFKNLQNSLSKLAKKNKFKRSLPIYICKFTRENLRAKKALKF